jgi:hypothetical protein
VPHAKGRELPAPVVSVGFTGEGIVFRIDDNERPEFWLALECSAGEMMELLVQWQSWKAAHYPPGPATGR